MLSIRWLNGEVHMIPAPQSRADVEAYVRQGERNKVVRLFCDDKEDFSLSYEPGTVLSVLVTPETSLTKEETRQVMSRLSDIWNPSSRMSFRDRMNSVTDPDDFLAFGKFRKLLIQHSALLAGDSILRALEDEEDDEKMEHRFDVFVHRSKCKEFIDNLCKVLSMRCVGITTFSDLYIREYEDDQEDDRDVFDCVQNRIQAYINLTRSQISLRMVVAIVADDVPLEKVVTNFDLSFRNIFWDGNEIRTPDPDGIRQKEGILQDVYMEEFSLNTVRRIRQYRQRGYTIHIQLTNPLVFRRSDKKDSLEEWSIHFFLSRATDYMDMWLSVPFFLRTYHPTHPTYPPTVDTVLEDWPSDLVRVLSIKIFMDWDWVCKPRAKQFAKTFRIFQTEQEETTFFLDWEWSGEMPLLPTIPQQSAFREMVQSFTNK